MTIKCYGCANFTAQFLKFFVHFEKLELIMRAKISNGVLFTNYLSKWICFKIIYLVGLFLYYKALLCWAHFPKWRHVAWVRKWWPVRRDHTWWSARYFLSSFPIKLLLLLRSICTTKSLKWFTLSWVSLLAIVCIIVKVFYTG